MHIVVVEDNADLRAELVFQLRHAGHDAQEAADAVALDACLGRGPVDLVLLDLGLPGEDGFSVARRLAARPGLGIVILSARGTLDDRVCGVELGADAYLVKPVHPRELRAVVERVHARLAPRQAAPAARWVLDAGARRLRSPAGVDIALTGAEFRLLAALAATPDACAGRPRLAEALGQSWLDFDERRLEVAVSRLRRKLRAHGAELLHAERGVGYCFGAALSMQGAA